MFTKQILQEYAEQIATDAANNYVKVYFVGEEDYEHLKKCIITEIMVAFGGFADAE